MTFQNSHVDITLVVYFSPSPVLQRQVLLLCPKRMLSSGDLCPVVVLGGPELGDFRVPSSSSSSSSSSRSSGSGSGSGSGSSR